MLTRKADSSFFIESYTLKRNGYIVYESRDESIWGKCSIMYSTTMKLNMQLFNNVELIGYLNFPLVTFWYLYCYSKSNSKWIEITMNKKNLKETCVKSNIKLNLDQTEIMRNKN